MPQTDYGRDECCNMELKTIGSDAFAATSPVVEGVTGRYFGDYDEATRERVIAARARHPRLELHSTRDVITAVLGVTPAAPGFTRAHIAPLRDAR